MLKGQDLTPTFGAHACARSALRARQRRWRPQRSSPRALSAVISISAAPAAHARRDGPRAAGQTVPEGTQTCCRGSGAPPGAQSCVAGAHAASPLPCSSLRILEITRGPRRPRQSAPLLCLAHAVATLF